MVDIPTATANGVAVVTTPDGVRRPVATSVMAFLLSLTMKLPQKSTLPHNPRTHPTGVGLVGRTLGILGMGSIGAEVFRLAKPFVSPPPLFTRPCTTQRNSLRPPDRLSLGGAPDARGLRPCRASSSSRAIPTWTPPPPPSSE